MLKANEGYLLLKRKKEENGMFEITRGVGIVCYEVINGKDDEVGKNVYVDNNKVLSVYIKEEYFIVKREDVLLFEYE